MLALTRHATCTPLSTPRLLYQHRQLHELAGPDTLLRRTDVFGPFRTPPDKTAREQEEQQQEDMARLYQTISRPESLVLAIHS